MILPIIMSGGCGSRLWPLSRLAFPKQFIPLHSTQTLLQETVIRLAGLSAEPPLVICNEAHRFIVAEQLRKSGFTHGGILLEPVGRNTAPAIALAAMKVVAEENDPLLLILPADHVIKDTSAFLASVKAALPLAEQGQLVTFGIVPTQAHTGYGYIRKGDAMGEAGFAVDSFVEKPDLVTAQGYLESKEYLWNSGMFMFKASRYLDELKLYRPDIFACCEQAMAHQANDLDFTRVDSAAFEACPDESIDYAVMEKTQDAVVIPMDAGWSDVGSWSSLWEVNDKDANGNTLRGDVIAKDTHNSYVYSQDRLVATVGVDDMVVVETKDAVLVAHKDKVQQVKQVVEQLKADGRCEHLQHREVFRPWGSHDAIAKGERYHVKKVVVKPGQKTALQKHFHRAEHWVVVSGTAKVYNDGDSYLVSENESTFIPIGAAHSFENPGKVPLEIIEVRSGNYLKEDDIVRLDNDGIGY